jgi:hypothetical protein
MAKAQLPPAAARRTRKGEKKEDVVVAIDVDLTTPTGTQQTAEDDDELGTQPLTQQTQETTMMEEEEEPLTQQTQQTADTSGKAATTSSGKQGAAKEMALMVPEKVLTTKVLVQFDKNAGALDLSGDVGAVGRFLVNQKPKPKDKPKDEITIEDQVELRMDLKGQLYNCRLMPTCTTMVIRMEKTEAKVESIAADVLKLEHDAHTQQGRHLDSSALLATLEEKPAKSKKLKTS